MIKLLINLTITENTLFYTVNTTNDKNMFQGTSLVVQWVRLHAPNAGGPGSIPGQEMRSACMPQLRSPHAATKSLHATTKRSACCN